MNDDHETTIHSLNDRRESFGPIVQEEDEEWDEELEDVEEELEDGQEKCPICSTVNWPGAMDFCQHYLWTVWDGQTIWVVGGAESLCDLASAFVDMIYDALDGEWLENVVVALREEVSCRMANLAEKAHNLSQEDILNHKPLETGIWRETSGMLSGQGNSMFSPIPVEYWVTLETEELTSALALIGKHRPGTH